MDTPKQIACPRLCSSQTIHTLQRQEHLELASFFLQKEAERPWNGNTRDIPFFFCSLDIKDAISHRSSRSIQYKLTCMAPGQRPAAQRNGTGTFPGLPNSKEMVNLIRRSLLISRIVAILTVIKQFFHCLLTINHPA